MTDYGNDHVRKMLRDQAYRDAVAHRNGWPVPPTFEAEPDGTPPNIAELMRAVGYDRPVREITAATVDAAPPVDPAVAAARREQAAHDAVEDAEITLARIRRGRRIVTIGLLLALVGFLGSGLSWVMLGWWAGLPQVIASLAAAGVLLGSLPGGAHEAEDTLRKARRGLRDTLTDRSG